LSPLRLAPIVALTALACATSTTTGPDDADSIYADAAGSGDISGNEPARSDGGSDLSTLPSRYPQGEWVRIESALLSMQLLARVEVNGKSANATIDTGAMTTVMSVPMAVKLGVLNEFTPEGRAVRALDAHGQELKGERLALGELRIGKHRWVDCEVLILGDHPDLFLVGADLLKDVDLYIAGEQGLLGVFEAGQGPKDLGDRVVHLGGKERQLRVTAAAPSEKGGLVDFELIVDTGASGSSVPAMVGINKGLPADLSFESTTLAVGGERTSRGRFVLEPMKLGPERVDVGRVLAISSVMHGGENTGLLGNDVLMREHVVISFRDRTLRFRRPPERPRIRTLGPSNTKCTDDKGGARPCVVVELRQPDAKLVIPDDAIQDLCLRIDVDEAYAGRTLEMAITADKGGKPIFNGGALRAYLTVGQSGAAGCFALWSQLTKLGLDRDVDLSLRWMRTEGVVWPCNPLRTHCLSFTGPLAKLPVR
jgi:hypothetical protein